MFTFAVYAASQVPSRHGAESPERRIRRIDERLSIRVRELAEELEIPGVAVGVFHEDEERYAFHGVTSVDNPLPVDAATLFQFGSTGKTYTSVALLRLVEAGKVELDAPVRTYVPELALRDAVAAETVTVLHLLNHTAGWDGDCFTDTGDGDDALARYVDRMADLEQITPPGSMVSYNNAALSLAGRIIEKVTGSTYEQALRELVLDPVGLDMTLFFPNDVMTRRFAVGHRREPDGTIRVLRPWSMARSGNPMGGMSASAPDQVRWARFHLDHGRATDGTQVVDPALIDRMQQPTADMTGSDLGDAVGISWLLSEVGGERVVAHGGSTTGQYSGFAMVPSRRFAIVSLTNAEPHGPLFNRRIRDWALETYLGLEEADPVHEPRPAESLAEYAGTYATVAVVLKVSVDGDHLLLDAEPTPELIAQLGDDADHREEPIPLGMLPGPGDRYVVPSGPYVGGKGYFTRDASGRITGIHEHGRFTPRVTV
jgi:CubicO group peptidase (beta-lactamase class C family)